MDSLTGWKCLTLSLHKMDVRDFSLEILPGCITPTELSDSSQFGKHQFQLHITAQEALVGSRK